MKAERCLHCKAPGSSVLQGPLRPNLKEKSLAIDTDQYKITHTVDEVVLTVVQKKLRDRKRRSIAKSSSSLMLALTGDPLTQSWSGHTFMSEYEEFMIDMKYMNTLEKLQRARNGWQQIKQMMKVHTYKMKMNNAGPGWFQDLSPTQIEQVELLPAILQADFAEYHCPRTQKFLFDIGIAPEIPCNIVAATLKETKGKPIDFMFKIHERLVRIETNQYEKDYFEAKKNNINISPFSVNERILLTCVFQYHFPTFLKKLDWILPPAYEEPLVKWGARAPKRKQTYPSPYLEPLPLPEKPWFEERLEEELKAKVERQARGIQRKRAKELVAQQLKRQENRPLPLDSCEPTEKSLDVGWAVTGYFEEELPNESGAISREANGAKLFVKKDAIRASTDTDMQAYDALVRRERKSSYFRRAKIEFSDDVKGRDSYLGKDESRMEKNVVVCDTYSQTSIQGVGMPTLYQHDKPFPASSRGDETSQPAVISVKTLRRSLPVEVQTEYDKEFGEMSKERDEERKLLRAIKRQQERLARGCFIQGIFGKPTDDYCITNCLLDVDPLAYTEDVHLMKPPDDISSGSSETADFDLFPRDSMKAQVPRDMSFRELSSVTRTQSFTEDDNTSEPKRGSMARRMSGPAIPSFRDILSVSPGKLKNKKKKKKSIASPFLKKPYNVECVTDDPCGLVPPGDIPMDEFDLARKKIELLPPKQQLSEAVKFLCEKGDPLAVLPDMDTVPWLTRWFDRRRGHMKKLTKQDKDELMKRSQTLWNSVYMKCTSISAPDVSDEAVTWAKKEVVTKQLSQKLYEHRRKVKHRLIDNARDLFPTMFCEYFDTPLNKAYRKTYYAYFPVCERDTLVVRPWNPGETVEKEE